MWANISTRIGHYRRDWSLITGRGATKREGGGACEVLPLWKGGAAATVLAILKFWGIFYAVA